VVIETRLLPQATRPVPRTAPPFPDRVQLHAPTLTSVKSIDARHQAVKGPARGRSAARSSLTLGARSLRRVRDR
jgi:hypothetical protein